MKTTEVRFIDEIITLASLQEVVRLREDRIGALLAISPCDEFADGRRRTCCTFEVRGSIQPGSAVELQFCPGGVVPTTPGKTAFCLGDCYVEGQLRRVAAFR